MTPCNRHRALIGAALAALAAASGLPAQAHQGKPNQERCYGIAKAGDNSCNNLSGTHECAGDATVDFAIDEWKYVARGTCKRLGGWSEAEAKARFAAGAKALPRTQSASAPPVSPQGGASSGH